MHISRWRSSRMLFRWRHPPVFEGCRRPSCHRPPRLVNGAGSCGFATHDMPVAPFDASGQHGEFVCFSKCHLQRVTRSSLILPRRPLPRFSEMKAMHGCNCRGVGPPAGSLVDAHSRCTIHVCLPELCVADNFDRNPKCESTFHTLSFPHSL